MKELTHKELNQMEAAVKSRGRIIGIPQLPVILWIIIFSTALALFTTYFPTIMGKSVKGYAWFIPLLFSLWTIMIYPRSIRFPFKLWLPWISLITIYLLISLFRSFYLYETIPPNVLQRTVQPLASIFVGMAVSTCRINESHLNRLISILRKFAVIYSLGIAWMSGALLTGIIRPTGLAGQTMIR